MTPTHFGHAPDQARPDPGDQARCPMERLGDRIADCPRPFDLKAWAYRNASGDLYFELCGTISRVDQWEDLINFLARVKG
jgi:hypothetical protein